MKATQQHAARILLLITAVVSVLACLRLADPLNAQQLPAELPVSQASDREESFQSRSPDSKSEPNRIAKSRVAAANLLQLVLRQLVSGAPFDAKVREIVWTTGREVIGVGTYEQSGENTGRFNLQLTMHDGKGKHRLQQISDGRLVWTRSEISEAVKLTRVDLGKLLGWAPGSTSEQPIPPRLQVGAWAEMLATLRRDYDLSVTAAKLKEKPVFVITGQLREQKRKAVLKEAKRSDWPMLYPTQMRVAVNAEPDSDTNFGVYLPVRIEFWSDPITNDGDQVTGIRESKRRLITLVELYSIRPITTPSPERFRFENVNVDFTNETERYIQLHDTQLTQSPTTSRR